MLGPQLLDGVVDGVDAFEADIVGSERARLRTFRATWENVGGDKGGSILAVADSLYDSIKSPLILGNDEGSNYVMSQQKDVISVCFTILFI